MKKVTAMLILLATYVFLSTSVCAAPSLSTDLTEPEKIAAYKEAVSQWKSYEDLAKWLEDNFKYDKERQGNIKKGKDKDTPRSAHETFARKSGVSSDCAYFTKETLNRINPDYQAKIVFICTGEHKARSKRESRDAGCYMCSFNKDGKTYIMDYAANSSELRGVHGPFNSLDEYKKYWSTNSKERAIYITHVKEW